MLKTVCDGCGKGMRTRPPWGDRDYYFPHRIGRRTVYLGVHIYRGRPNRRRRERRFGAGMDLCRRCVFKILAGAAEKFRKEQQRLREVEA